LGTLPAFAFCAVALLVNFTAGYWLARCGVRLPLTRRLERRGWRIPQLSAGDESMAILILRVTPGVPLCIQNYLLGLAGVKFGRLAALVARTGCLCAGLQIAECHFSSLQMMQEIN